MSGAINLSGAGNESNAINLSGAGNVSNASNVSNVNAALRSFHYDLHMHSCLSPCADDDMTPCNIANMAMLCGIEIAALTDHNTLKNCPAFFSACEAAGVLPVAGTELCTREEVHVICLFPTIEAGLGFDRLIDSALPSIKNRPDIFGRQLLMDAEDTPAGEETRLLLAACDISIDELVELTARFGGAAIPAHIDRGANSLITNLGFIPDEYKFTCYEVRDPAALPQLTKSNPVLRGKRIVHSSDAHNLLSIPEESHTIALTCGSNGQPTAAALIHAILGRV